MHSAVTSQEDKNSQQRESAMASSALCCAVLYPRPHPTISQVDTTYVLHYVKLSYQIITNISTQMEG